MGRVPSKIATIKKKDATFSKIRETFQEADPEIKVEERKISLCDPSGNGILITAKYGDILEEVIELEAFFQMGNQS